MADVLNRVKISGPQPVLEEIIAKGREGYYSEWSNWSPETRKHETETLHSNVFAFENFLPAPQFETGDELSDWCLKFWGTRWPIFQTDVKFSGLIRNGSDFHFTLEFPTENQEALAFWDNFSKLYPQVQVTILPLA